MAHELTAFAKTVNGTLNQNLTLSYNANGDRTGQSDSVSGSSTTLGYDEVNRLTSYSVGTTSATYAYNGDGLRMSKTVNGVTTGFIWDLADGMPLILQAATTKYVTGMGGLPIEQIDSTNIVLYYYQDQPGSTRQLLDSTATVKGTFNYNPYGDLKSSTGTATTPFGYAGQYTDSESGLQYLRARYYDPATEQFLSVDPLRASTGEPYAYTVGNPLNAIDPWGLDDGVDYTSQGYGFEVWAAENAGAQGVGSEGFYIQPASEPSVNPAHDMVNAAIAGEHYVWEPGVAAVLETPDGHRLGGFSGSLNRGTLHSSLESSVARAQARANTDRYRGACAEVNVINLAMNQNIPVEGARMWTWSMRRDGGDKPPCPVCELVLAEHGITFVTTGPRPRP